MALISFEDIQTERNITLTDPNGESVAEALINAATAWVSRYVGYPIEAGEHTTYFSNGETLQWLPTNAPVSDVVLAVRKGSTYLDRNVDSYFWDETGQIEAYNLPTGPRAVRAVYTAGWTNETVPADLRDALIDLVTLKLQAIANFSATDSSAEGEGEGEEAGGGQLKKLSVDGYTEEYSTAQSDAYWKAKAAQMSRTIGDAAPPSIKEVLDSYRLSFVL